MKVTVDTTGKTGMLMKHVTIYSSDRVTPVRTVSVSLEVVLK